MREGVYFTNLLEEGSNISNDFMLESPQGEVSTQQFPSEIQLKSIAKKPTWGIKFTVKEDILLISTWLNISMDGIQGNQQKHKAYWEKIYEYSQIEKTSVACRIAISLMNHGSTIQFRTNKFCGCLAHIERGNESGLNEQDKVNFFFFKVISMH